MRYFGSFGNLYNAEAIKTNQKIAAHGAVVLRGLGLGLNNLDDMKNAYAALGKKHSDELKIDPDNFRVCLLRPSFSKYLHPLFKC